MIELLLCLPALPFLYVCWHVLRNQTAPADTSNRINKIRLLWFAWTRSQMLCRNAGVVYKGRFPTFMRALRFENEFAAKQPGLEWLRRDEAENVGLK